jgi:hypothetical protein
MCYRLDLGTNKFLSDSYQVSFASLQFHTVFLFHLGLGILASPEC